MIKIENIVTPSPEWWQVVVNGTRNPMNSWDKSDSELYFADYYKDCPEWVNDRTRERLLYCVDSEIDNGIIYPYEMSFVIGPKDLKLLKGLANAGPDEGKFLRQLPIICDVTAPLYWWKQADKYQVGTTTNSQSTMHRLTEKEFSEDDFSIDSLYEIHVPVNYKTTYDWFRDWVLPTLRELRHDYLQTKDPDIWRTIIQILPESYNQKRTLSLNYAVLRNMYHQRKHHKLGEWHDFLEAFEGIPYFKELIVGE